jgi:hypothetical protein
MYSELRIFCCYKSSGAGDTMAVVDIYGSLGETLDAVKNG